MRHPLIHRPGSPRTLRDPGLVVRGVTAALLLTLSACSGGAEAEAADGSETLSAEEQNVREQLQELYDDAIDAGETEVNAYTLVPDQFSQREQTGLGRIVKLFEDTFPEITVNGIDGSAIEDKVAAEASSGNYVGDVVLSGDTEISTLKDEGHLAEFSPAGADALEFEEYTDPAGYAYSPYHLYNGIIYNTSLLSAGDVPTTWEELGSPEWKDKFLIVHADGITSLRTYVNLVYNDEVDDTTKEQIRTALDNGVVTTTFADVSTRVLEGEYEFSLFGPGAGILASKDQGLPVDFVDSELTLHNNLWSAVFENAPNPHAAKLFHAFQFSQAAQDAYATETFYLPNIAGAAASPFWPEVAPQEKLIPFGELGPLSDGLADEFRSLYPAG